MVVVSDALVDFITRANASEKPKNFYQVTQHCNPEDSHLYNFCVKSYVCVMNRSV
jgi:hypothetical protein